jgi:hypothetical protein
MFIADKKGLCIGFDGFSVSLPNESPISLSCIPDIFFPLNEANNFLEENLNREIDLGNGRKLTMTFNFKDDSQIRSYLENENFTNSLTDVVTIVRAINDVAKIVTEGFGNNLLSIGIGGSVSISI